MSVPMSVSMSVHMRLPMSVPVLVLLALTAGPGATAPASSAIRAYKGLRYASPPTGPSRFLPARLAAFNGTGSLRLSAVNGTATAPGGTFGPACTQPGRSPPLTSEDCLFLNVWSPSAGGQNHSPSPLLPVLFWIHGGGFRYGAGSDYDGSVLVSPAMSAALACVGSSVVAV
jgi:carboxylesterase type B